MSCSPWSLVQVSLCCKSLEEKRKICRSRKWLDCGHLWFSTPDHSSQMALKGWGEFHTFALASVKQFSPGRGRDQWGSNLQHMGKRGENQNDTWASASPNTRTEVVPSPLQPRGAADGRAMPKYSPSPLLAINSAFINAPWGDFLWAPPPSQHDGDPLPRLP